MGDQGLRCGGHGDADRGGVIVPLRTEIPFPAARLLLNDKVQCPRLVGDHRLSIADQPEAFIQDRGGLEQLRLRGPRHAEAVQQVVERARRRAGRVEHVQQVLAGEQQGTRLIHLFEDPRGRKWPGTSPPG